MTRSSTLLLAGTLTTAWMAPVPDAQGAEMKRPPRCGVIQGPPQSHPIDLVICLDTSGSMTALIDSARAKLWDVVNELATAQPTPHLRVGLLTYGTPGNSRARDGWVKLHNDLTDDLDTVYANMMSMRTSGGDEYVGWVLHDALTRMNWSPRRDALKIIFVAGNESADQAMESYNFRHVAKHALGSGIFVNSIYGGNRQQGVAEKWHEVAIHGGGNFSAIDMKYGTIQIPTPYDSTLSKLNDELNNTYVAYGRRGRAGAANQIAQDSNAAEMGSQSCASRVIAKAGALYTNGAWDLVDASEQDGFDLDDMPAEELPENMRKMTPEERQAYVLGMKEARQTVQEKIKEVDAQRRAYLQEQRRMSKDKNKSALHEAMLDSLRKQAETKGFEFPSDC